MGNSMDWSWVFFFLFLFSLIVMVIGTINPKKILPKRNISRIRFFLFSLLASFLFLGFSAGTSSAPQETPNPSTPTPSSASEELGATTENTPEPEIKKFKVVNVVDGDTLKLEGGEVVRLIGIDAPETKGDCYATEATRKLEELTLNKEVELEKDVSETDRYKRLLRYIRIGDSFINEVLVREGYATVSTYPPDVRYKDKFIEAERLGREENKGLWGETCKPTSTPVYKITATLKPTVKAVQTTAPQVIQQQPGSGSYTCNCSKTCSQMSSCTEAQYQLNTCGCYARDADDDGIACDSNCQ